MAGQGKEGLGAPPEDEVRAIAACQQGDRSAFELIVKRYAARAVAVARGILRDAGLAEDVAQEAFVRAFRAIRRFDRREQFYPWFYRIVRNASLTALKRRRRREASLDSEDAPPVAGPPSDPSAAAARHELRARLEEAMAKLSNAHREILHLAHFEGLAYKEIAACLSIPVGTVMSRLWSARRALRRVLEPTLTEGDDE